MRCLSFVAGDEFFAVDVTLVQKVARKMTVTPVPTAPDEIVGIANIKGRVVTILSLCELLGRKKNRAGDLINTVDAVVFKPFSGSDQIGLVIDKPGNLIDIDDGAVSQLSLKTTAATAAAGLGLGLEESFCISGIAEVGNRIYRIISIDSIIAKYKHTGEKAANTNTNNNTMLNGGGNENDG